MSVSEEVLNNMGSLEGLIAERGYTTGVVRMQGETILRTEFDPSAPAISDQDPYAVREVVPAQSSPGVVPGTASPAQPVQQPVAQPQQAQPQISKEQYQAAMAYANRMREQAEQAAIDKQEAEDKLF